MYRFLIVIEKANGNYSSYSPDLPGCVATGSTREEVEQNMYEVIVMHVGGWLKTVYQFLRQKPFQSTL
jgi:predicted RNase H-like HicB family nuclease